MLTRPKLLLMDEATVGLDPASRDTLLHYVHELGTRRELCVLWATHLIDEAEAAQRVLVLHRGQLLADGSPEQLMVQTGKRGCCQPFAAVR
ncbi:MAG: hypothetical protein R3E95_07445 [Thiolinea sp.]